MNRPQLHKVQVSILYDLRHKQSASFSDLMRPTGLTSDDFKFYVKRLQQYGYIEKMTNGHYTLTIVGKEFANTINEEQLRVQKQPKLSVLVVLSKLSKKDNERLYLVQQRLRNPYFGFWSLIGGPVQWDESFAEAAQRELGKQTGLSASFTVKTFCRKRDYIGQVATTHEDKLFVLLSASEYTGKLTNDWPHGTNTWMTLTKLSSQLAFFEQTLDMIKAVESNIMYQEYAVNYSAQTY